MQAVRAGRYFFGCLIALAINFKFSVIVGWVSIQFIGYAWLRIGYVSRYSPSDQLFLLVYVCILYFSKTKLWVNQYVFIHTLNLSSN